MQCERCRRRVFIRTRDDWGSQVCGSCINMPVDMVVTHDECGQASVAKLDDTPLLEGVALSEKDWLSIAGRDPDGLRVTTGAILL